MSNERRDSDRPAGFSTAGDAANALMRNLFSSFSDAEGEPVTTPKTTPARHAAGKLEKATAEITAQPDKVQRAYIAREVVQCTLPHTDPGDVPVWIRRNGNYALGLQSGVDLETGKFHGLPYGPIPRLILFWIITEANRKKKTETDPVKRRYIKLGDTLSEFLNEIGYTNTGRGKNSNGKRVKQQMRRLFSCRIGFLYSEESGLRSRGDMRIAKTETWWDSKNPDQASFFESYILLDEDFFEAITAAPVPVDFRALKALKKSSFALDLYAWATYRISRMQQQGQREVIIPLEALQQQFGSEYNRFDNFKAALLEALAKVKLAYRELDYSVTKDALILRDATGRPAIARRGQRDTKALDMGKAMSQQVSQKVRERFTRHYQLHNVEDALAAFYTWRDGKEIESTNADAHFWDFVRNHYFTR